MTCKELRKYFLDLYYSARILGGDSGLSPIIQSGVNLIESPVDWKEAPVDKELLINLVKHFYLDALIPWRESHASKRAPTFPRASLNILPNLIDLVIDVLERHFSSIDNYKTIDNEINRDRLLLLESCLSFLKNKIDSLDDDQFYRRLFFFRHETKDYFCAPEMRIPSIEIEFKDSYLYYIQFKSAWLEIFLKSSCDYDENLMKEMIAQHYFDLRKSNYPYDRDDHRCIIEIIWLSMTELRFKNSQELIDKIKASTSLFLKLTRENFLTSLSKKIIRAISNDLFNLLEVLTELDNDDMLSLENVSKLIKFYSIHIPDDHYWTIVSCRCRYKSVVRSILNENLLSGIINKEKYQLDYKKYLIDNLTIAWTFSKIMIEALCYYCNLYKTLQPLDEVISSWRYIYPLSSSEIFSCISAMFEADVQDAISNPVYTHSVSFANLIRFHFALASYPTHPMSFALLMALTTLHPNIKKADIHDVAYIKEDDNSAAIREEVRQKWDLVPVVNQAREKNNGISSLFFARSSASQPTTLMIYQKEKSFFNATPIFKELLPIFFALSAFAQENSAAYTKNNKNKKLVLTTPSILKMVLDYLFQVPAYFETLRWNTISTLFGAEIEYDAASKILYVTKTKLANR